jgi:flagellar motility protein MotE (MotC chaperone)
MNTLQWIGLVTAIGAMELTRALWNKYAGDGYLKRKGENLATKEDLNELVHQMSEITKATKNIEAEISQDAWSRQKHWELKREVLFETTRRIAATEDALRKYAVLSHVEATGSEVPPQARKEKLQRISECMTDLEQATYLAMVACSRETVTRLKDLTNLIQQVWTDLAQGNRDSWDSEKLGLFISALLFTVRKELDIPDVDSPSSKPGSSQMR